MIQGQGVKINVFPYRGQTHGLKNVAKNPVKKKREQTFYEKYLLLQLLVLPFDGLLMKLNREDKLIYIKIKTGRFLLPGWRKNLPNIWHI